MNTQSLKENTIAFIKKYGYLDDREKPPDFRAEDFPGYTPPQLECIHPWYRNDLNLEDQIVGPISGDMIYKAKFSALVDGLLKRSEDELRELPLAEVPDSEEYVLLDTGSHLGRKTTRPFAVKKPHVKVYMIDNLNINHLLYEENYRKCERTGIAGKELVYKVKFTGDIEEDVNRLMDAIGYMNIRYIQRKLVEMDGDTNLKDIERELKGKRMIFTGFRNPKGLGNTTLKESIYHGAERIYMNNTALENMDPYSGGFALLKGYLKDDLTAIEIDKLLSLICAPRHLTHGEGKMYDYQTSQRYFATALKQLFALSQADMLETNGYDPGLAFGPAYNYNQSDHNFAAVRNGI